MRLLLGQGAKYTGSNNLIKVRLNVPLIKLTNALAVLLRSTTPRNCYGADPSYTIIACTSTSCEDLTE